MVNVGDALKNGMETTDNTHPANDCFGYDCGGSFEVKFKLDLARSVSLLGNYSNKIWY